MCNTRNVTGVTHCYGCYIFYFICWEIGQSEKNCTKSQFRIYLRDVHFPLAFNYYGGLIFLTILAYFQPAWWKFGCFHYRSFFTKLSYFSRIILLSYHITTIPSPPATIKTFSCTPHPFWQCYKHLPHTHFRNIWWYDCHHISTLIILVQYCFTFFSQAI